MSQRGRSERVDVLRAEITRIEGNGDPVVAFDGRVTPRKIALGRGLDALLGGGLSRGSFTEVVAARPEDATATSGFALALAVRFARATSAPIVWVIEDNAWRETGAPYAPGLSAHGLDPDRLVVVRTRKGVDALWATEEALKCRAVAAVVTDLWGSQVYDLVASRRLVLAAGRSGTPGVFVPHVAGGADAVFSAAQVRFEIRAALSPHLASADRRQPLPGPAAVAARLARIRAGPTGITPFDWRLFRPLVWDHEEALLCDALPLLAPALSRDRSHPAAAGRRCAA